jgi:hypothetical protein|tara:strand:+ start:941 stop:1180 length:240 start_codon:yes stop_codon:yes gene_type:complete
MNTASKIKGAGRGRTKGSFSFITVSAETLNGFPNVVVSRKWAEAVGIADNLVAKNSLETFKKASVAETETPALQVTIED